MGKRLLQNDNFFQLLLLLKQPFCIIRIWEFNIFPQLQWRTLGDLRRHKILVLCLHAAIVRVPVKAHQNAELLYCCLTVWMDLTQVLWDPQSPRYLHWIKILSELCLLLWLIQLRRECTVPLQIHSGSSSARGGSRNWIPGCFQEAYFPNSFMSFYSEEFRLEVIVVQYEISATYTLMLNS